MYPGQMHRRPENQTKILLVGIRVHCFFTDWPGKAFQLEALED